MRIAIPVSDGLLNSHFGSSNSFWLCDATMNPPTIAQAREVPVPATDGCSALAAFLKQQGVDQVIAGGIGAGAVGHLQGHGIKVAAGVATGKPQDIATEFLAGRLAPTGVLCHAHAQQHGHGHGHAHGHHHGPGHGHGHGACGHRGQEKQ